MSKTIKVLMMPDYRADNPYQLLLANQLRSRSLNICFFTGYRRVLPLFRAVKDNSADVLHLHWLNPYLKGEISITRMLYSLKFLLDLWLIHLSGVKIIWTVHNFLSHNAKFPQLEMWVRKKVAKIADKIIVHHSFVPEYLRQSEKLKQEPVVIAHGHYRDLYPPAIAQNLARKQLNLDIGGLLYLNLGTIRPYKGIESLLQAWQEHQPLSKRYDTLLIAGKPIDRAYGKAIESLIPQNQQIIFQGQFIPNEKLHLYFSAADVVILPFTNILTSGSLILAMSYGKPVIAPRLGGIVETIGGAGDLLYDTGDLQGLLKAIKASTEIDLLELGERVKTECDRLGWDKIARQTAQLYQSD